ncbi:MAG: glycosyltransferase, partial [Acidimicrobiia bacterium]
LHTVLGNPTSRQQKILEQIIAHTDQAVVMSDTALRRLVGRYGVDPQKLRMIPHGARAGLSAPRAVSGARPVVLTWGLIGPGKGLETAIEAFAGLKDLRPQPEYVILGKTHPKVQAAHGDAYLNGLRARVRALGLEDVVEFDSRYLDVDALAAAIQEADIVLLPYESTEQVTSGVLVEAIAAGKPVVATAFPHAVEMLGAGAGVVVPHSDANAIGRGLRRLLTDPALARRMATVAAAIGETLQWPVVATEYERVIDGLVTRDRRVGALTTSRNDPTSLDDLAKVG